ncbi:BatA domain-containing protein [Methanohalophilus profundi]|uniref:BatA domain-containing protein n=1 Tax=Methanohalophilus profundi TaxID=2138083 RepID=UPI001CDD697E|nr:BatA domain-containing protein [Methanohalophilus profundi]
MPFDNTMALAALASVIPLIIIYLLRPKPVQLSIPSLMFLMQVEKQKKRFHR